MGICRLLNESKFHLMKRVEKFLMNPEFVRWVKNSDPDLDSFWNKWLDAHPEALPQVKKAKEIILGISFQEEKIEETIKSDILKNILKETSDFDSLQEDLHSKSTIKKGFWEKFALAIRVAAILLVFFSITFVFFKTSKTPVIQTISKVPLIEKSTSSGEKLHLTLPDGSEVWLNSESKIIFPQNFGKEAREIILDGEGFFEVMKDTLRPFSVKSNGLITEALGTSFNINSSQDQKVKVSLVTGKVVIKEESKSEEFYLNPGQQLSFDLANSKADIEKFSVFKSTAWKDGILVFENAGLNEVIYSLEKWYGVHITLVNATDVNWNFSGEYQNQILETVLNSMSYAEEFEYEINGKNVELKF